MTHYFQAKQKYQYDKKHSKGKVFEKGVEVLMKDSVGRKERVVNLMKNGLDFTLSLQN